MNKIWAVLILFCSGGNFERLMSGETDSFFGTHWLLVAYVIAGLIGGWSLISDRPALSSPDGNQP